jgi:hypothetical protein
LKPGWYVARVTTDAAKFQPNRVRDSIGTNGERLKGPLTLQSPEGTIATLETRFAVGEADPTESQITRLRVDVASQKRLLARTRALFSKMEEFKSSKFADETEGTPRSRADDGTVTIPPVDIEGVEEAGPLAQECHARLNALMATAMNLDNFLAGIMLIDPLGDLRLMFLSILDSDNKKYVASKANYEKTIAAAADYVAKSELKLSQGE